MTHYDDIRAATAAAEAEHNRTVDELDLAKNNIEALEEELAAPVPLGGYVRPDGFPSLAEAVHAREAIWGRRIEAVRNYQQLNIVNVAPKLQPLLDEGRTVVVSYSANYSGAVSFESIARGDHDNHLRAVVSDLVRLVPGDGELLISLGQEGEARLNNPSKFPGGAAENSAEDYAAAWRRFAGFFPAEYQPLLGQTLQNGQSPLFVPETHWVGLDLYNKFGALLDSRKYWGKQWEPPSAVITPDVSQMRNRTAAPIYLTELGCGEGTPMTTTVDTPPASQPDHAKGLWLAEAVDVVNDLALAGVLFFDVSKEAQWQVDSTPLTLQFFKAAAR